MTSQNYFIFLELLDKEICALLHQLRFIFNGKPSKSNIHITVRGPYKSPIKARDIEKYSYMIERDVITVSGVGRFDNDGLSVVYMKIASRHLEDIWWKPDYPMKEYGFNPHISLYVGKDTDLADKIFDFLRDECIALETRQFELTPYVSNQFCLLSTTRRRFEKHFLHLIIDGKVKGDVVERARCLVDSHHAALRNTHSEDAS